MTKKTGNIQNANMKFEISWNNFTFSKVFPYATLSEEIAHLTVYHHLSQHSVNIQLNGLIKCREDSGVQMKLTKVIFRSLSWSELSELLKTVESSDIQLN